MAPPLLRHDAGHYGSNGGGRSIDVRDLAADSQELAMAMSSDSPEARHAIGRLAPDHSPAVMSIHQTLLAVTAKLDAVKTSKEELVALAKICAFLAAASVIVVSRQQQQQLGGSCGGSNSNTSTSTSASTSCKMIGRLLNLGPLESCVEDLELLVERLGKRRKPLLRRSNSAVKAEIVDLNSRVADLTRDMGLAGVLAVFKGVLEDTGGEHGSHQRGGSGSGSGSDDDEILTQQEVNLARQPVEQARVPSLTPRRESWHVRRERVISTVLESLLSTGGGGASVGNGAAGAAGGRNARPHLVGLVGESGSGKTATAADIVRSPEVLEYFSGGVVWLPVNEGDGSKERLPSVMHRLAGMVREEIGGRHDGDGDSDGSGGDAAAAAGGEPAENHSAEDSAAYIKGVVEDGVRQRRQRRCLVVADNVWEREVVAKLRETGMWVLLTSCKMGMIEEAGGNPVVIGRLVEADADRVLRRAAELPSDEPSPAGAKHLTELCGRMALDLSFVGRWSTVRGSKDPMAWQNAADNIRADLQNLELTQEEDARGVATSIIHAESSSACGNRPELEQQVAPLWSPSDDEAHTVSVSRGNDAAFSAYGSSPSSTGRGHDARGNRRRAVLRAGFRDLVDRTGDDDRVRGLYVALAVLPDGHEFTAKDAAVLLHERDHRRGGTGGRGGGGGGGGGGGEKGEEKGEEEKTAEEVLKTLETWGILVPAGERWESKGNRSASYRMHRAHSSFARGILLECHEILGWAVRRWVGFISSLDAVLSVDPVVLARLWQAVEDVGGTGWRELQPYERALSEVDNSDPLCRVCLVAVAIFRSTEGDWGGASLMWRHLLAVEQQAQEPNVMYPLWELVNAAEMNGKPEEAASWRQHGYEALNLAMARSTPMTIFCTGAGGSGSDRGYTASGNHPNDTADTAAVIRSLTLNMARFGPSQGAEAERMLRRALEIEESRRGPDDTRVASTLQRLGICVRQAGRLKEARQLLKRALKIKEATLGEDDVQVARTAFHLAVCLRLGGRFEDAERLLRRATDVETAKRGGDDVYVARALHELGLCARLSKKGDRHEEATRMFARALAIREDKLGPDDPSVGQNLYELGRCFRREGRHDEAEACLRRALAIKKVTALRVKGKAAAAAAATTSTIRNKTISSRSSSSSSSSSSNSDSNDVDNTEVSVALATFQLGVCVLQGGQRLDEAEGLLRSVLDIEEERLGPDDVSVARIAFQLGVCLRWVGRREEAESVLMGCVKTLEVKLGADHEEVTAANEMLDLCAPTE